MNQRSQQHIAFFAPSLRGGGAERVVATLANGFARAGHRVDLVLAKAEGPYLQDLIEGVRVVDLGKNRVLASLMPLARYLRHERPDVLLSVLNHANLVAVLARKIARVPLRLAVSERNAPSAIFFGSGKAAVLRELSRRLLPAADVVIGVSKAMKEEIEAVLGIPPEKVRYVYNPLDLDLIHRLMDAPIGSAVASASGPLIVAVGRLTAQKDYPVLLKAFASLSRRRTMRLAILGQGEEEASLKALAHDLGIADRVFFMGFQRNPYAWMKASDLYVLSSRWEGLPNTLLEALACGTRAISTDCRTGPSEILEGGKWGRLVPVGDPEALAEAIDAALDEPECPELRQRADDFRPEHILKAYAQLMQVRIG